jgi:hypothetical protein
MSHPFGDLLSQYLHRKHGLSQSKLAAGILQAPTLITGICKGRRLTGLQARERVITIIGWLQQQNVLASFAEANALLNAAGMAPLQVQQPAEALLLRSLPNLTEPGDKAYTGNAQTPHAAPRPPDPASTPHNLPAQLTPFGGRTVELAELANLLASPDVRLMTVLGSGRIGKTRLALAAAAQQLERFRHGVYFVSLAGVDTAYAIIPLVADVLNFTFYAGAAPHQQLGDYLRHKNMLLVLDNFEHLLNDGAGMGGRKTCGRPLLRYSRSYAAGDRRYELAPDVLMLIP